MILMYSNYVYFLVLWYALLTFPYIWNVWNIYFMSEYMSKFRVSFNSRHVQKFLTLWLVRYYWNFMYWICVIHSSVLSRQWYSNECIRVNAFRLWFAGWQYIIIILRSLITQKLSISGPMLMGSIIFSSLHTSNPFLNFLSRNIATPIYK